MSSARIFPLFPSSFLPPSLLSLAPPHASEAWRRRSMTSQLELQDRRWQTDRIEQRTSRYEFETLLSPPPLPSFSFLPPRFFFFRLSQWSGLLSKAPIVASRRDGLGREGLFANRRSGSSAGEVIFFFSFPSPLSPIVSLSLLVCTPIPSIWPHCVRC